MSSGSARAISVDDSPLLENDPDAEILQYTYMTWARFRRRIRWIVDSELFDVLILFLVVIDVLCVTIEALIGYGVLGSIGDAGKHIHYMSLVLLSFLMCLNILEIIGLGVEWYTPHRVAQFGIVLALLYMELVQCWEEQLCTWGGLAVFLLIPYRLNTYGYYATILDDIWNNPEEYRVKAARVVDHPVTHVGIVGLVLADFLLLLLDLMLELRVFGTETGDRKLAMHTLSRLRLTIYGIFAVEILLELFVGGWSFWYKIQNVVDFVTVYLCLCFEIFLPKDANDYVQLIVVMRLWRLARVFYGVSNLYDESAQALELSEQRHEDASKAVEEGATMVQDKVDGLLRTASDTTGGVTDSIVGGIADATGIRRLSEAEMSELNVEFKTLSIVIVVGIVLCTGVSFAVLYLGAQRYHEDPMLNGQK